MLRFRKLHQIGRAENVGKGHYLMGLVIARELPFRDFGLAPLGFAWSFEDGATKRTDAAPTLPCRSMNESDMSARDRKEEPIP